MAEYLRDYMINPPEAKVIYHCCKCNTEIYEGETYYLYDGWEYCTECFEDEIKQYEMIAGDY